MTNDALRRLDDIDRAHSRAEEYNEEAGNLMREFAGDYEGLLMLVQRYAGSSSPAIAQALGFWLAAKARGEPTQRMARLVLTFLRQFRCKTDGDALSNPMTATQHILHYWDVEQSDRDDREALFEFIKACLSYQGRLSTIIKAHALGLLSIVQMRALSEKIFTAQQVEWLRDSLRQLAGKDKEELADELRDLAGF